MVILFVPFRRRFTGKERPTRAREKTTFVFAANKEEIIKSDDTYNEDAARV